MFVPGIIRHYFGNGTGSGRIAASVPWRLIQVVLGSTHKSRRRAKIDKSKKLAQAVLKRI
jgi:hypothetical protein